MGPSNARDRMHPQVLEQIPASVIVETLS